jgi:hypothetical protein
VLVCVDGVSVLGGGRSVKGMAEVLLVAVRGIGVEMNVGKTRYLTKCRGEIARRS